MKTIIIALCLFMASCQKEQVTPKPAPAPPTPVQYGHVLFHFTGGLAEIDHLGVSVDGGGMQFIFRIPNADCSTPGDKFRFMLLPGDHPYSIFKWNGTDWKSVSTGTIGLFADDCRTVEIKYPG